MSIYILKAFTAFNVIIIYAIITLRFLGNVYLIRFEKILLDK